jgi:hypothetical protein
LQGSKIGDLESIQLHSEPPSQSGGRMRLIQRPSCHKDSLAFFILKRRIVMKKVKIAVILIVAFLFSISVYAGNKIISAYASVGSKIVYTVPSNKILILTDIFTTQTGLYQILQNSTVKTYIQFGDENPSLSIHLISGLPFSSGSKVTITKIGSPEGNITITGYLIDQ